MPTPAPPAAQNTPRRHGWSARYDTAALRPPALLPADEVQALLQHPAWPALQHWCLRGSGPGTRPWTQPGALPALAERLTIAHLAGADASALATALCLERDGSLQLRDCRTAAARLSLRLLTKLHDAMWWRARRPADAWDSGHVIDTPAGLQALARFTPRRATLLVADALTAAKRQAVIAALRARQSQLPHPVRLLLLDIG